MVTWTSNVPGEDAKIGEIQGLRATSLRRRRLPVPDVGTKIWPSMKDHPINIGGIDCSVDPVNVGLAL
jgi:hypothetical protein